VQAEVGGSVQCEAVPVSVVVVIVDRGVTCELVGAGRFLRQWSSKRHPFWRNPRTLLKAANALKITRSMLENLTEVRSA
jgi:hypothetical protein